MATKNPKRNAEKITAVVQAWTDLRPTKSFAGMTLAEFKLAIKPSIDARTIIAGLDNQMIAAEDQRDAADIDTMKLIQLVVNAIKGDKDEGEDGALYEAMGYVRKSERKSGLTRPKKTPTPA